MVDAPRASVNIRTAPGVLLFSHRLQSWHQDSLKTLVDMDFLLVNQRKLKKKVGFRSFSHKNELTLWRKLRKRVIC